MVTMRKRDFSGNEKYTNLLSSFFSIFHRAQSNAAAMVSRSPAGLNLSMNCREDNQCNADDATKNLIKSGLSFVYHPKHETRRRLV